MFKPTNSISLAEKPSVLKRIAIQGEGGTGKTTAALTFPNPVVLDFDNSVDETNAKCAGKKLDEVIVLQFYNQTFIDTIKIKANRRDAFKLWLEQNILKFSPEQTVILDSWTALQDEFDKAYEPVTTKSGEIDEFHFWGYKQEYAQEILTLFRQAPCNTVVLFHEVKETDKKGNFTGGVSPLMQGKFVHKLSGYFTNWFRSIGVERNGDTDAIAKQLGINKSTLQAYIDLPCPVESQTMYLWQLHTTTKAGCKTKLMGLPRFVPANYDVFINPDKYK